MSGTSLVPLQAARLNAPVLPALVRNAGPAAQFAWDEFFGARVPNPHTRAAYLRAVRRFLAWLGLAEVALSQITPAMVGAYLDQHLGGPSGRKLSLAALRAFFDCLVNRHVCMLNPAATVRGEKYQVTFVALPGADQDWIRLETRKRGR